MSDLNSSSVDESAASGSLRPDSSAQLSACRQYMERVGLLDSIEARAELADVLSIPRPAIDRFSRYGRLGLLREDALPA
jgi:hypothetical protein